MKVERKFETRKGPAAGERDYRECIGEMKLVW
jgi:hypothetical protein